LDVRKNWSKGNYFKKEYRAATPIFSTFSVFLILRLLSTSNREITDLPEEDFLGRFKMEFLGSVENR